MRAADEADALRRAGESRPLLGVLFAVKANIDVAGAVTSHGTDAFTRRAPADAEVVRMLLDAGAIRIGIEQHVRARPPSVYRVKDVGRDTQPVGHDAHARRVQRRIRRRGIDPRARRLLRPVRPQAPARPRSPRAPR